MKKDHLGIQQPMHILVTNVDGITAPGLLALAKSMRSLGEVTILAPDRNWSATGHMKTIDRPLRVREVILADGTHAWTTDGTPSDCVALANCGFLDEPIDLVVSGFNSTAILGHDVTYSGSVTAAMEAAIWDIPAVAFSLDSPSNHLDQVDYSTAAGYASKIVKSVQYNGLLPHVLLNVNVPYLPEKEIQGIMVTRQGLRVYHDKLDRRQDPRGNPYYWTSGDLPTGVPERGTDFGALTQGYVSITPIQLDLTAYKVIPDLNGWDWNTQTIPTVIRKESSIFIPG